MLVEQDHAKILLNIVLGPQVLTGVLLEFPVSVLSVLIRSSGFVFCPVAVYLMILCSCRPL
jgi:hypothetical protein